jgi:hypothetical protein
MLSLNKIERLAESGYLLTLLDAVSANGRPLPVGVRAALTAEADLPLASLGLAVQRTTELSYLPTPGAWAIGGRLVGCLLDAGLASRASAGAVALALGGLSDLLEQAAAAGVAVPPEIDRAIQSAMQAGVYRLFEAQAGLAAQRPADAGLVGSAIDSALLTWQLAGRPALVERVGRSVNLRALDRALGRREVRSHPDVVAVLARAVVVFAPSTRPFAA